MAKKFRTNLDPIFGQCSDPDSASGPNPTIICNISNKSSGLFVQIRIRDTTGNSSYCTKINPSNTRETISSKKDLKLASRIQLYAKEKDPLQQFLNLRNILSLSGRQKKYCPIFTKFSPVLYGCTWNSNPLEFL